MDRRADRAVSTVVSYVVLLGVLAVLVSVVLVGATDYVDGRREQVIRSELEVLGNRLAADLTTADALAGSTDRGTVEIESALPERVARSHYRVSISDVPGPDSYALTLESTDPTVVVTVPLKIEQDLATGRYGGGDLVISYDGGADRLEVARD